MRAAGVREFGAAVEPLELPAPPEPAPDEVLIRMRAAGVGNWDAIVRDGAWEVGGRPPCALGVEGTGVIDRIGTEVTGLEPGESVLTHAVPLREQGAWAELMLAPANLVARKPEELGWMEAAALPVPGLTADQVVTDVLELKPGDTLLVSGAGSVTGGLGVQLAALRGVQVFATAGPASADRVRGYGAAHVVDYADADWPERVRELSEGGVDAALNAARGSAPAALHAVRDGGRLATITQGAPLEERGISIFDIYVAPDARRLEKLASLAARGDLQIPVGAVFPLEEAAAALDAAIAGRAGGGVVVTLDSSE